MISVTELRKGRIIKLENDLFSVVDYAHHKPGKGKAYVKTKLRNLDKGSVIDKTFYASDTVEEVFVERKPAQYLYQDGENYVIMDLESYDQIPVPADTIGDGIYYLKEEMEVEIDLYDGHVINVEMPNHVILEVTYSEPGLKGDTAGSAKKPAEMETGLKVNVPLFIETGDKLKIDTRTGEYIERM